jgi:hypothetical protein
MKITTSAKGGIKGGLLQNKAKAQAEKKRRKFLAVGRRLCLKIT